MSCRPAQALQLSGACSRLQSTGGASLLSGGAGGDGEQAQTQLVPWALHIHCMQHRLQPSPTHTANLSRADSQPVSMRRERRLDASPSLHDAAAWNGSAHNAPVLFSPRSASDLDRQGHKVGYEGVSQRRVRQHMDQSHPEDLSGSFRRASHHERVAQATQQPTRHQASPVQLSRSSPARNAASLLQRPAELRLAADAALARGRGTGHVQYIAGLHCR